MSAILLIRHGLNDTMGKYLAGRQVGIHLNDEGKGQAHRLPEILKDIPIHTIYSSPLERTMETAEPLAKGRGLTIQPCPGLIELDYGYWQGKGFDVLRKLESWKAVQESPENVQFPAGESMVGAQQRIRLQIDEINSRHNDDDVVACFTHNDVIKLAVAHYLNMPLHDVHRLYVCPASVTAIMLSKHPPVLLHFNQTGKMTWPPPVKKHNKNQKN